MLAESYKTNLGEAQNALAIATNLLDEYKHRDMIVWGRTPKGFEGWLVKGKKADDVYTGAIQARSDVEHWGNLLAAELRRPSPAPVNPPPLAHTQVTTAEFERRQRELAEQMAARLGEKPEPDGDNPF